MKGGWRLSVKVGDIVKCGRHTGRLGIIIRVLKECEDHFHQNWQLWPEEVKLIIANMAFNLGITKLKKFQLMLTAINAEDYKTASKEGLDSRWAKQVYNRSKRLMDRLRDVDVTDKFDSKGRLLKK